MNEIDNIPVRGMNAHELSALVEQGMIPNETENLVISALRRVDITDANAVHADIAVSQSISAPIISVRAELDILIRTNRAKFERNEQEIKALAARHKAHVDALNAENDEAIARLVAIGEQISNVLNVLEITNRELSKQL